MATSNPVIFGFLVALPIGALWVTKAFIGAATQLPDTVSYSGLLPAIYGLIVIFYLFALNWAPLTAANFAKIYLPIIVISLIATFAFSAWAKSYFETKGYTQCQSETLTDRIIGARFEKNGKCP